MNGSILIVMLATIIPVNILLAFMPYMTRQTEIFGVTVNEKFTKHDELRKLRRYFALAAIVIQIGLLAVFFTIFLVNSIEESMLDIPFAILILLQLAAVAVLYLIFHKKMNRMKLEKPEWFKKNERLRISTDFRNRKLTVSNIWFLIPLAISILTIGFTFMMYEQMPGNLPMQYNMKGEAFEWVPKTYKTVFMLPAIQLFMTGLFIFINIIIRNAKQQIAGHNPEIAQQRNIIFRRRWSAFLLIMGTLLSVMLAIFQASLIWDIPGKVLILLPMVITLVVLVGCVILSVTTGQGGSRVKIEGESEAEEGSFSGKDDDRYWKLGVFYFNKNDPSIFIEKRFGIGWTNNWAHPLSWVFVVGIIVLGVGLPLFFTL